MVRIRTPKSGLGRRLEDFRASTQRPPLPRLELALLWVVSVHVCFLPWALGGMRLWAQIPSAVLAALGFSLALIPRRRLGAEGQSVRGPEVQNLTLRPSDPPILRLARFPLFYLGGLLLLYVTVQALNPAWEFQSDAKNWWMATRDYIYWLPSGVDVPFDRWGPWRMLVIYGSVWLTICSIWVGFTERRTLQRFLVIIAINGLALAVFGVAQRLTGASKILWLIPVPRDGVPFSSFIYKNHGGAYLALTLSVACGLAAWFYRRGLRKLEKSNPSGLFAFIATVLGVAVLISYARGVTFAMIAFLAVGVVVFVIQQFRAQKEQRRPMVAVVLILVFGGLTYAALGALAPDAVWNHLREGIVNTDKALGGRQTATEATVEMWTDHFTYGNGSGSFEFIFPNYQNRYPEIWALNGTRLVWEHAHDDPAELAAELGLIGLMPILCGIGYVILQLFKYRFWKSPLISAIAFMLVLLLGISFFDFPFQCPAILTLAATLGVVSVMWLRMSASVAVKSE